MQHTVRRQHRCGMGGVGCKKVGWVGGQEEEEQALWVAYPGGGGGPGVWVGRTLGVPGWMGGRGPIRRNVVQMAFHAPTLLPSPAFPLPSCPLPCRSPLV